MTTSSLSPATISESLIIFALSAIILVRLVHGPAEEARHMTVTTLHASANPTGTSDRTTLTASVRQNDVGLHNGTIRFYDETDRWLLGIADASSPSIVISGLKPGVHTLRAHYSGVPDHATYSSRPSVSEPLMLAVLVSPKVALSVLPEVGTQSGLVTVTATVKARDIPTGSVTFRTGEKVLAKQTLDQNGRASFITSALEDGVNHITAEYQGDGVFAPAAASIHVRHGIRAPF